MRVLIVHPRLSFYGGAELVIVKLCNYLVRKGIENAVLTLEISPQIKKILEGTEIILSNKPMKFHPRVPFTFTLPFVIAALSSLLRRNADRFDIINVHNFPAEIAVIGIRKRVVWMCNEPSEVYFESPKLVVKLLKKIVVSVDRSIVRKYVHEAVVADEFNAKRFERIYGMRPKIIPYGIDHQFFSSGNASRGRNRFGLNKEDFVLLQVGVITEMKNQRESVEAVEKLKHKIPHLKLVLAGDDSSKYAQELKRYVRDRGLEKHVLFTGHLPRDIVRDLYAGCDVNIFPVKSQGGWLSPFEAMCAGKPVIVSPEMTASSIIEKNRLGIVSKDLAAAVLEVYHHPDKYKKMARTASVWVKKNLSWEMFCERMLEVLHH